MWRITRGTINERRAYFPADVLCEFLRVSLDYNAETGKMTWKAAPPIKAFPERGRADMRRFETRRKGKPAFSVPTAQGYLKGRFLGVEYLAHRIAWLMTHGVWPSGEIDHINGIRTDNRLINLRDVSKVENCRNICIPSTNKSGAIGVSWAKRDGKWSAYIKMNGRRKGLGYYVNFDDAVAARKEAERIYGFHDNHGRPRSVRTNNLLGGTGL